MSAVWPWGCRHLLLGLAFHIGAGDLNLRPRAYAAEPWSPDLQIWFASPVFCSVAWQVVVLVG